MRILRASIAAFAVLAAADATAGDPAIINPASAYPEGPLFHRGILYYAEMGNDRVMRWDGVENRVFWSRQGCGPTAVAPLGDDGLAILCHLEGRLILASPDAGTLSVIAADDDGRPVGNPNAATADGRGGAYLSSSGRFGPGAAATGAVLHLGPDRRLRRVAEGIHYANGVAVGRDGRLYVSEHLSRNVLAFDIGRDGSLSGRTVFVRLDNLVGGDPGRGWEVGPDGLQVDRDGNLYIAEYGAGRILVVDPQGRLAAIVAIAERYVTGLALSADERALFVTAPAAMSPVGGTVYAIANPLRSGE